ncbi:DMT family transporter [Roseovarius sp.]|uniref:DMT family transporter n=1 Tax=Roseovarius sp. TaxID=1486281 RepID=UPI0025FF53D8|nr:DMT family transporter [Roseovarius sp.]
MLQSPLLAVMIMAVAGMAIALQAPINSALGRSIDSSLAAAAISFGVGFATLLVLVALGGETGAFARAGAVPKWLFLGGALGAFYVWAALWGVPILGVLTTITVVILGQMAAALLLDYIGAFGLVARDLSPARILAVLLVAGGVILSRY